MHGGHWSQLVRIQTAPAVANNTECSFCPETVRTQQSVLTVTYGMIIILQITQATTRTSYFVDLKGPYAYKPSSDLSFPTDFQAYPLMSGIGTLLLCEERLMKISNSYEVGLL